MCLEKAEENPLKRVIGNLGAPGAIEKIEALTHMDPTEIGILTGEIRRKTPSEQLSVRRPSSGLRGHLSRLIDLSE